MGRKEPGGCCATFAEKLGPGLTMWPGPRSTSVPSGILIHPALWPLQTRAENWGLRPLFYGRGGGSHLTQCGQGRELRACHVSP